MINQLLLVFYSVEIIIRIRIIIGIYFLTLLLMGERGFNLPIYFLYITIKKEKDYALFWFCWVIVLKILAYDGGLNLAIIDRLIENRFQKFTSNLKLRIFFFFTFCHFCLLVCLHIFFIDSLFLLIASLRLLLLCLILCWSDLSNFWLNFLSVSYSGV